MTCHHSRRVPTSGQDRTLTAVPLVAHVPAVVVIVTLPDAVDAVPVGAPVLVGQAGVLWGTGTTETSWHQAVPPEKGTGDTDPS